jgi:hypothetical protein
MTLNAFFSSFNLETQIFYDSCTAFQLLTLSPLRTKNISFVCPLYAHLSLMFSFLFLFSLSINSIEYSRYPFFFRFIHHRYSRYHLSVVLVLSVCRISTVKLDSLNVTNCLLFLIFFYRSREYLRRNARNPEFRLIPRILMIL